jgi:hypothetical protein
MPAMKSKFRAFLTLCLVVAPSGGVLPGCSEADNPKMQAAAPPPPPKAEELEVPKVTAKKGVYGAHPKYQRAMDRMSKQGQGE